MSTDAGRAGRAQATDAAQTVSLAVYEELRALIVRGRLVPGTRVTEAGIADELRVSRTPAREALRRLRQEGLLVNAGDEGGAKPRLSVAPLTAAEVTELYHAAGALEGVAALEVATLSADERHTLAARLTRAEDAFRREARRRTPDWDRLFESHDAFHRVIVGTLAGPRLRQLLDALRPHLDRYEYFYGPLLGPDHGVTFEEHAAIIGAIAEGDAAGAERAVRANWFGGAERLTRIVERAGERASS